MKNRLEDLSVHARRRNLSKAEAHQLEQHLDASPDARLWHRAGCAFDAEDVVLPGDHAATERVLDRLARRTLPQPALPQLAAPQPTRSRPRFAALLVAAALLAMCAAAAAVMGARALRRNEASVAPTAAAASVPSLPRSAPVVPIAPETALSAPTAVTPNLALNARAPSVSTDGQTPADLLSAAGQARRQGYSARAIDLLSALQTRFPNSPEARSSDISLGMLQLKSGAAAAAERHFDHYLERSPNGALASEALWGQAQAAFARGNEAGGRRSLASLLERYPASPYASAARARLRAGTAAP